MLLGADVDVYFDDVNVVEEEALCFGLRLARKAGFVSVDYWLQFVVCYSAHPRSAKYEDWYFLDYSWNTTIGYTKTWLQDSTYLKELQSSVDNLVKFTFPLYSSFVLPEDFMQTLFCYFWDFLILIYWIFFY